MSLYRHGSNKFKSAAKFRAHGKRTKVANMNGPQRGGWRL